jgi:flagellin
MPLIATNNAANQALNYLKVNTAKESTYLAQLASGKRIVQASVDSAGLAIGTQLDTAVAVYQQDTTNVTQGTAILQTADGALAQISNVLQRMITLASASASGQVSSTQRVQDLNVEYSQLKTELSSIVNSTSYAGRKVLSGSFLSNVKFLVGTGSSNYLTISVNTVSIALTGTGGLLGSGSTVSTQALALASLTSVSVAISTIAMYRAKIGAYESQFNFSSQDIATNIMNTQASSSVIMDADVASVKSALSTADVLTQAAIAAVTQASQLPAELLRLIQS